ncbi:MAG: DUF1697 domain-containing protein [Bacteroidota bacterium]
MAVFITLLRGINVSGQKKIKMADFRTLLTESGLANVSTYIQSGNIVCQFDSSAPDLSEHIASAIQKAYGYEVEVFSYSPDYFSETISQSPYGEEKIGRCYVTFLSEEPEEALVSTLKEHDYSPEEWHLIGDRIYFYSPQGYGRAKMNNNFFEKKLKVKATTRNWRTVLKMKEMAESN